MLLPQLTPSLIAAALLTFMTSMASFSAPLLFGGNVRVLTLEIFTARQRGDIVMAVTETVILAIISLGALIVFQRYEGTRRFAAAAMKGAPRRRVSIASGKARALATIVAVVFAVILVLPVATLFLVSFAREGSWTTQTLPSAYTFANYQRLFSDPYAAEVFFNSVTMSAIAAVAALVWSFCVVTFLRAAAGRTEIRGRRMAAIAVAPGFDSVGVARNGGGGFGGRSVRTDRALCWVRLCWWERSGSCRWFTFYVLCRSSCARFRQAWSNSIPRSKRLRVRWARARGKDLRA